ncbi:hypothetical protein PCANB_001113 [Pneumocystis canis]|nr:hypothetical protein PCK1_001124 [Pneumocystis canis]KAG5437137.1 hypothetical protein PCANB_001113 [Pneumocystis canis]
MNTYIKFVFVPLISCLFSTILYAVSWPYFSESSNPILKSISSVPLSYSLVIKFVELELYFTTKHVYDTVLLIFISRIPWIYICCLIFSSPLWILLLLVVSDIYVLSVPFYLLSYHKYSLFGHKKAKKVNSIQFSQDCVLTILLSALISSIHSIFVYIVTKLTLVPLLSIYSETGHLIAPIPLPILLFAFFPLGFCIQKIILLFGPHKAFLYITFTLAWVTTTQLFLLVRGINFSIILISFAAFWSATVISFFAVILCFKS